MGDLMFFGVLGMPERLAMNDELSRHQFYSHAQECVRRLCAAEDRNRELTRQVAQLDAHNREIEAEMVAQSKDVRRYAWLKSHLHSVDFAYLTADDESISALIFDMGNHSVTTNLDKTIDAAMALTAPPSSSDPGRADTGREET